MQKANNNLSLTKFVAAFIIYNFSAKLNSRFLILHN